MQTTPTFFWPCCTACGILVPLEVRNPIHWTARKFSLKNTSLKKNNNFLFFINSLPGVKLICNNLHLFKVFKLINILCIPIWSSHQAFPGSYLPSCQSQVWSVVEERSQKCLPQLLLQLHSKRLVNANSASSDLQKDRRTLCGRFFRVCGGQF